MAFICVLNNKTFLKRLDFTKAQSELTRNRVTITILEEFHQALKIDQAATEALRCCVSQNQSCNLG